MEDPVALAKAAVGALAQETANDIELILERVANSPHGPLGPRLHGSDLHAMVDSVLTLREKIDGVIDQLAQRVTAQCPDVPGTLRDRTVYALEQFLEYAPHAAGDAGVENLLGELCGSRPRSAEWAPPRTFLVGKGGQLRPVTLEVLRQKIGPQGGQSDSARPQYPGQPAPVLGIGYKHVTETPPGSLAAGGVFSESGIPTWHQARLRVQEMLRNGGTEEEVSRTLEFLREGWTGGEGRHERTPGVEPSRLRNDAYAQRLKADFTDLWPNPHAADWHPGLTPQALYAVPGADRGEPPERGGWTLSWLPDMPGWETDGGRLEYGLPRHVAEELAAVWNADEPGLWPRESGIRQTPPPTSEPGGALAERYDDWNTPTVAHNIAEEWKIREALETAPETVPALTAERAAEIADELVRRIDELVADGSMNSGAAESMAGIWEWLSNFEAAPPCDRAKSGIRPLTGAESLPVLYPRPGTVKS